MSAGPHATNAGDAFLTTSQVAQLQLNADAVILSGSDSSGLGEAAAAEGLAALARSFFFAGARALLVPHWSANDQVTRLLIRGTMELFRDHPQEGLAGALAQEERDILRQSVGDNAMLAHPYFWSPFAVIGDGGPLHRPRF
jgi:CHAT domain-containing protein